MAKVFKKSFILSLSIVGSIVGVGFITGKEIMTFFARYGILSLPLCFMVSMLFGLLIYFTIATYIRNNNHINKKRKTSLKLIKNSSKTCKSIKINAFFTIFDYILIICQISICSAMFAGFDLVFKYCDFSYKLIVCFKTVLAFWLVVYLLQFKQGVYVFNSILSFAMILFVVVLFFVNLKTAKMSIIDVKTDSKMFVYPVLYVGMNLLTVYPLVEKIGQNLSSKKECFWLAFFTSILMFIVLVFVTMSIVFFGKNYVNSDMIMLSIAGQNFVWLEAVYLMVILVAIVSTLFSTAYGGVDVLSKFIPVDKSLILVVLISFVLSFIGFSDIIDFIYPLLGLVCIIVVIVKILLKRKMSNDA